MGPKRKSDGSSEKKSSPTSSKGGSPSKKNKDLPPSAGYLISCDVPTKQYIQHLNELKPVDKKFILEDLDATHLLVKKKVREEIERKVEAWMDENVFSAVERVGEDLDMS
jgi:TFIIH basal transcription factor complex TTD-A subunit